MLGNVRPDIMLKPAGRGKDPRLVEPRIILGSFGSTWGQMFGAPACQLMFAATRGQGLGLLRFVQQQLHTRETTEGR